MSATHVVKVGGSLYDLPDLAERLRRFLATLDGCVVLFPGGGITADAIRAFDRVHRLGEEASHWLALRALSVNAHLLGQLLPGTPVIDHPDNLAPRQRAIVDPFFFAQRDEANADHCPHRWEVTSDSLALRVAQLVHAGRLVLLKSIALPAEIDWAAASERGWLDGHFARQFAGAPVPVRWLNLRDG